MARKTVDESQEFEPVADTEELPPVVAPSNAPSRKYFESYEAALAYWTPGREITMEVPAVMEAHRDEIGYWIP